MTENNEQTSGLFTKQTSIQAVFSIIVAFGAWYGASKTAQPINSVNNQSQILENQITVISNQETIKTNLANIVANQEKILKALRDKKE
jgi:hypothetical protein